MIQLPWRDRPLTKEEADDLFMFFLEDDTEDAPWMVMGDLQFWSASGFAQSLRAYADERGLNWYVAAMLPINFRRPGFRRIHTLAPDTFVAFVPRHARTSYDVEAEGAFPPFVLEVVSPSSTLRDYDDKLHAYDTLGVKEYTLFTPREGQESTLEGYKRDAGGLLSPWQADEQGRLWSDVLGLFIGRHGTYVQASTREGRPLLMPQQEAEARRLAEAERVREAEARRLAEAEVERLRRELERYRGAGDEGAS